ncbi:Trm112 family protein [Arthrobacter pigmenti]
MPKLAPELLSVLRCPVTGSALIQQDDTLVSSANGPQGEPLHYVIDEGIPVLLPDPATADSTTETGQE